MAGLLAACCLALPEACAGRSAPLLRPSISLAPTRAHTSIGGGYTHRSRSPPPPPCPLQHDYLNRGKGLYEQERQRLRLPALVETGRRAAALHSRLRPAACAHTRLAGPGPALAASLRARLTHWCLGPLALPCLQACGAIARGVHGGGHPPAPAQARLLHFHAAGKPCCTACRAAPCLPAPLALLCIRIPTCLRSLMCCMPADICDSIM